MGREQELQRFAADRATRADRLLAIDLLRGFIMALMALDHTRDFFLGFTPDPTDLETTTPELFATRWITHICAPGFLMLAGVSAYLHGLRGGGWSLSAFLASRGAILIALEVTLITFAWAPDPSRSIIILQVIWAIGWAMLLLSLLLHLGPRIVGLLGAALILGHPFIGPDAMASLGAPDWIYPLLWGSGRIQTGPGDMLLVIYAILPWAGALLLGYGLGPLFERPVEIWRPLTRALGLALIVSFLATRALTAWGDPVPWVPAQDPVASVLSFLNVEKYPPSPLYYAATLGIALLLLGVFARLGDGLWSTVLSALGRAPLFFYVLHLYALRIAGVLVAALVWGVDQVGPPPLKTTPEWPLWAVWAVWLVAMAILFFPTRWFARLKATSKARWIRYF